VILGRARVPVLVVTVASTWIVVGGLATGSHASAHAVLETASPADGELLEDSPSEVVATFTEPPDPELSTMRVLDPGGAEVGSGPAEVDPSRRRMTVPVDDLTDGVYTVAWRAVSQVDGHVTAGSYSFGPRRSGT
jgi:methionine-rich copper-binding protein CopC